MILDFKSYNNIHDIINSLNLDKIDNDIIKKQYKDYYNYHRVCFNDNLIENLDKDYALLEGITKSYPLISAKKHLIKGYNPQYKYKMLPQHLKQLVENNPIWYDRIVNSSNNAHNTITSHYDLEDWQFIIQTNYDNTQTHAFIIIPNLNDNISIIDSAMKCFGYYRSMQLPLLGINKYRNMKDWIIIQYEQRIQEFINDKIKEERCLYHISPSIYEEKILKQGLVPKSKNDKFDYPDRIYLILDSSLNDIQGDLINIANMLYANRKDKSIKDYTIYKIDCSHLINTNFSIDYNFAPFAVFTADNIPPYAIEIMYKISIN